MANVIQIPLAPVTASSVRNSLNTVQGWRPTSVTIQPHSSATTAATPATAHAPAPPPPPRPPAAPAGEGPRPQEPDRLRDVAPSPPREREPGSQQQQGG